MSTNFNDQMITTEPTPNGGIIHGYQLLLKNKYTVMGIE